MENTEEIDVRALIKVLIKRRWVLALVVAVSVLTSAVLSFFVLPPVYEARATLLVFNATERLQPAIRGGGDSLEAVVNQVSRLPELTLNTYVNQLTGPSMLERTAEKLRAEFPDRDWSPESLGAVRARSIKDTNLVEVTVAHTDRLLAARVAETLSKEFLAFVSQNNQEQMSKSLEFLSGQEAALERDLKEAEARLQRFLAQPRGVAYLDEEMKNKTADLYRYQSELRQAQVQRELLVAGIRSAAESLAAVPRTFVNEDGAESLNPAWVTLSQLVDEKRVALAEAEAREDVLSRQVADLDEALAGLQAELTEKRSLQSRLEGEAERLGRARDLLSDKITETRIARSANLGETTISIVSSPSVPTGPVKPKKTMNVAVAAVLGGMVAVLLAFLLELLDNTIKSREDVERHLGLPVLGSIPAVFEKASGDARPLVRAPAPYLQPQVEAAPPGGSNGNGCVPERAAAGDGGGVTAG